MTVRVKAGVSFTRIAPAGFRLLAAIEGTARRLQLPLTITCACEGHPATDPHTKGEAYDVRSHTLTAAQQRDVLRDVLLDLGDDVDDAPIEIGIGVATRRFYGQLEDPGGANAHLHFQRRKGTTYP